MVKFLSKATTLYYFLFIIFAVFISIAPLHGDSDAMGLIPITIFFTPFILYTLFLESINSSSFFILIGFIPVAIIIAFIMVKGAEISLKKTILISSIPIIIAIFFLISSFVKSQSNFKKEANNLFDSNPSTMEILK